VPRDDGTVTEVRAALVELADLAASMCRETTLT
jgi:hypothetical protein